MTLEAGDEMRDEIERLRGLLMLGEVGAKALADAKEEIERLRYQLGIVRKSREHWLHKYISLKNTILKELDISDAPVEGDD